MINQEFGHLKDEIVKKIINLKILKHCIHQKRGSIETIEINKDYKFKIPPPINNTIWNDIFYNENQIILTILNIGVKIKLFKKQKNFQKKK